MKRKITIGILTLLVMGLLIEYRARGRREDLIRDMVDDIRSGCGQSSALLAEYHQLRSDITPGGYVVQEDFAGRFYTFKDTERLVIGTPEDAPYTLWIFGNSGTMDLYLADNDTFAMHLQGYFPLYRVRNRSAWGQTIEGQVAWLADTPIGRGDLVVFVDGYMDSGRDTSALIARANYMVTSRGSAFWHFLQPSVYPLRSTGVALNMTPDLFVEHAHLNERGTIVEARLIYDAISVY